MATQKESLTVDQLSINALQHIARFCSIQDLAALLQVNRQLRANVSKLPKYRGEKHRTEFFRRVDQQALLLLKNNGDQVLFNKLKGKPLSELLQDYDFIKKLQSGKITEHPDKVPSHTMYQVYGYHIGGADLTPLLAIMKLEIIKAMPAESPYFLNIDNEETQFDYNKGYHAVALFSAVGTAAIVTTLAYIGSAFALGALSFGLLPLMVGIVTTVACFAVAGHYGSQHQRGLYRFVLDESFLDDAQKAPGCHPQ